MVLNKKGKKGKSEGVSKRKETVSKKQDDKQVFDFNPYGGTIRIKFFLIIQHS